MRRKVKTVDVNLLMPFEFSDDQREAKRRIDAFLDDPRPAKQWFMFDGLAGVGKSVLLAEVAKERGGLMGAYTGKAASNLSRKTGLQATTVHSMIYAFAGKEVDDQGREDLLFEEKIRAGAFANRIAFVDECGTLDATIARDLLATGCRVVAAGDPGQLRPIKGSQFFDSPDFTLTHIHRQAWDSPIIRQAHAVRSGRDYAADGPAFRVQPHVGSDDLLMADAILCWRNQTRLSLNALKRAHLGLDGRPPQRGEPVMCLRNNHELSILNGAVYALEDIEWTADRCQVTVRNEAGRIVTVRRGWFEGFHEADRDFDYGTGFAYAYASTVHKSQGSEAEFAIVVDEYSRQEDRDRWLYTAFTRAKTAVLVQRGW